MRYTFEEEFRLDHPETVGEPDIHFDLENYKDWLEAQLIEARKQLTSYNVVGRIEQLKAEDKDLPFADYLEKWYELPRYEKVYDRKDGKGTDTENEVIKNYRRAFRL